MSRTRNYNSGFTLPEVLIAVLFVGLAIASLVAANGSFTRANSEGMALSRARFLFEQIKELTVLTDYDDLNGLDGAVFSPPIGVDGNVLSGFSAFSQQISVEYVNAWDFEPTGGAVSDFARVTVEVSLNSRQISSMSWIMTRYSQQ
jgi:type II secretory pathway pseudopilin PulG